MNAQLVQDQLFTAPVEGFLAEPGPGGLFGRRAIFPRARGRECCDAGGVVAVLGLTIAGELWSGFQGFGPWSHGGVKAFVLGLLRPINPSGVRLGRVSFEQC